MSLDPDHTLILDAGTGLYRLGRHDLGQAKTYFILLSHRHWDHIQGFPMFRQHMNPDVSIRIVSTGDPDWGGCLLSQLDGVRFPILEDELSANIELHTGPPGALLERFDVSVSRIRLNHRGACYGYRISTPTGDLCYITDHEMDAEDHVHTSFEELAAFCSEAGVLVHDATYTDAQMPEKAGLGHSTVERVCELAARAGVRDLVLFHHDPERPDDMLDELERMANDRLDTLDAATSCRAAYEGLELDV